MSTENSLFSNRWRNHVYTQPMVAPTPLMGLVHIVGILSAILSGIYGGLLAKKQNKPNRVYSCIGISFIVLELMKVVFMLMTTGTYPLERIPFQMCTVELFFLWAIPFIKKERIKKGMIAYTIFGLMAAIFYYVKPATILTSEYIFLSLQAMVWHDLVIMVGVFSIIYYKIYGKKGKSYIIDGYCFWLSFTLLAVILNVICATTISETNVNFFYLSPIQENIVYPVLNILFKEPKPYTLFILGFIIYYSLGVASMYGVLTAIGMIRDRRGIKQ